MPPPDPEPPTGPPDPEPPPAAPVPPDAAAILTSMLDDLGTAHHRPFSR